jgi:hypothetical protein
MAFSNLKIVINNKKNVWLWELESKIE